MILVFQKHQMNRNYTKYLIPKDLLNKPKNNRNEPYHLNHIATAVANLMKVDEEKLREQTYKNSLSFFEA